MSRTGSVGRSASVAIALSVLACTMSVGDARLQGTTFPRGTQTALCMDELGHKYSQGAMRKVVENGTWRKVPGHPAR